MAVLSSSHLGSGLELGVEGGRGEETTERLHEYGFVLCFLSRNSLKKVFLSLLGHAGAAVLNSATLTETVVTPLLP